MKTKIIDKSGREKSMEDRYAKVLVKLGRATYATRDMVPSAPADAIDSMDKDQLHELAKARGIKVHHLAGADKVRAAIRETSK